MPRVSVVAKNYAKALYLAAAKNKSIDKVSEELDVFKSNFSTKFAHELKNPVIAKTDLVAIISEITKQFNLGAITSNFFASIVRNRRLNLFPEIYEEFFRLINARKNILEVEVIMTTKPEKLHLDHIRQVVEKKYPGKTIAIKEVIKEKIIGGFQIKIGSDVIDASLRNQIENIRKHCLATLD